ncbi:MAG TPA: cold shock domain-containing protein [Bryobacteraceae bacterium]|nr:cold shock domain-containing protein [Bryobacteraceae bacterium]
MDRRKFMTLPPQITFRNMQPVPDLEPAVLKEIAVLERFFKRITSCRVMIDGPGGRRFGGLYHVHIDLGVPNEELVVKHVPSLHKTLQETKASKGTKQSEVKRARREVHRAIHDAFHEMRRRLQDYARRLHGQTKRHEPQPAAKVARLLKDHGFLETSDGREVYFHRKSVLDGYFDRLRVGSGVHFAEESGEKGPQASTVRLLHPSR